MLQATWDEEKKSLAKHNEDLELVAKEYKEQNSILHSHLQELTAKAVQIQTIPGEVKEGIFFLLMC